MFSKLRQKNVTIVEDGDSELNREDDMPDDQAVAIGTIESGQTKSQR